METFEKNITNFQYAISVLCDFQEDILPIDVITQLRIAQYWINRAQHLQMAFFGYCNDPAPTYFYCHGIHALAEKVVVLREAIMDNIEEMGRGGETYIFPIVPYLHNAVNALLTAHFHFESRNILI